MFWVQYLLRASCARKSMLHVGFAHRRKRCGVGPARISIRLSATAANASWWGGSSGVTSVVSDAHPLSVRTSLRVDATPPAATFTRSILVCWVRCRRRERRECPEPLGAVRWSPKATVFRCLGESITLKVPPAAAGRLIGKQIRGGVGRGDERVGEVHREGLIGHGEPKCLRAVQPRRFPHLANDISALTPLGRCVRN